jgi:S1-C subfamily serine protease
VNKRFLWIVGAGCATLLVLVVAAAAVVAFLLPIDVTAFSTGQTAQNQPVVEQVAAEPTIAAGQAAIPTLAPAMNDSALEAVTAAQAGNSITESTFSDLYQAVGNGVVSIQVIVSSNQGIPMGAAGSGFVLDDQGHIVTNNHVVGDAANVVVVFYNGFEERADIVGTDPDSDLAVIQVDQLPEGVKPLPVGDSDAMQTGDMVIAIGNPFSQASSMSMGIVSATGRAIPSGATPFNIPQAIQTDAAINPGNSGGPLINMQGEVIGVNAQIATGGGVSANAGVGFAIPSNVVRRVIPVLIEEGSYQWPWLGVSGGDVSIYLQEADNLPSQQGAYIAAVEPDGPADKAGLQGSTTETQIDGINFPTGGDVVTEADGTPIMDFNDLLVEVASHQPGDTMTLTVLHNGQTEEVDVQLEPRPENFGQAGTTDSIVP